MILSILIATTQARKPYLDKLLASLLPQINGLDEQIEILIETHNQMELSKKLNGLLKDAQGKYVWVLNDSDIISSYAISEIFSCVEKDSDYICIGTSYKSDLINDQWQLRIIENRKMEQHFPVKRELTGLFPKVGSGWVDKINKKVKTVEIINKPILYKR